MSSQRQEDGNHSALQVPLPRLWKDRRQEDQRRNLGVQDPRMPEEVRWWSLRFGNSFGCYRQVVSRIERLVDSTNGADLVSPLPSGPSVVFVRSLRLRNLSDQTISTRVFSFL